MPLGEKQYDKEMAALRKAHFAPNERAYWKIRDNIKILWHRLRNILNEQNSDFH